MNLFELFAKISLDTGEYTAGLEKASGLTQSIGGKIGGALGTAAKVGAAALGAASAATTAFAADAVSVGMQFDTSMSQVAATMGYSVAELNEEGSEAAETFTRLRDFAQEMGASTAFSASQSADALNYMALAGYNADQAMTMLPNVLSLAAAGSMDLARASDMITDSQSALGLSFDETAELVDKMARASSKSNTSVEQLGNAILTVGGTAKDLSGGTTEMATALGILADNGIKGAEGGTALRNVMQALIPKSEAAAKAWDAMGISAYDANGDLRPLKDTMSDMATFLSDKSTQERQTFLKNMFNVYDLKSVNALLAATGDSIASVSVALDESGIAWDTYMQEVIARTGDASLTSQDMISDITGLLQGMNEAGLSAVEQQEIIIEEYGLSAEDAATAVNVWGEAIAGTTNRFDELSGYIDGAWYSIGSLSEQLTASGGNLAIMKTEMERLGVTTEEFENALNRSGGNAETFADALLSVADNGTSFEDIAAALNISLEDLQAAFDSTTGAAEAMADTQLDNLAGDLTIFQSALEGVKIAVSDELTPSLRDFVSLGTQGLSDLAIAIKTDGLGGAMEALGPFIDNAIGMLMEGLPKVIAFGGQLLIAIVTGLIDNLPKLADGVVQLTETLGQQLQDNGPAIMEKGGELLGFIVNGIIDAVPKLLDGAAGIISGLGTYLKEKLPDLIPAAVEMLARFADYITDPSTLVSIVNAAGDIIIGLIQGLENALPKLIEKGPQYVGRLAVAIIGAVPKILEVGVKLIEGLLVGITEGFVAVFAAIPNFIKGLIDGFKDLLGIHSPSTVFADIGKNIVEGLKNGIVNVWESVTRFFTDKIEAIKKLFTGLGTSLKTIGGNIVSGLKNGISSAWEGAKGLAGWFSGKIGGLVTAAKEKLGVASPSKVFASIGGFMAEGLGEGWEDEYRAIRQRITDGLDFGAETMSVTGNLATVGAYSGAYGALTGGGGIDAIALQSAIVEALQGIVINAQFGTDSIESITTRAMRMSEFRRNGRG